MNDIAAEARDVAVTEVEALLLQMKSIDDAGAASEILLLLMLRAGC